MQHGSIYITIIFQSNSSKIQDPVLGRQTLDSSQAAVGAHTCYDGPEINTRNGWICVKRGDDQRWVRGQRRHLGTNAFEIASGAYAYMDVNHLARVHTCSTYLYPAFGIVITMPEKGFEEER
jgi:hypothetical protein